jgi:hypothetical protein
MNLNDLLLGKAIDPKQVLVLRHRPWEPRLHKVLPWLAAAWVGFNWRVVAGRAATRHVG